MRDYLLLIRAAFADHAEHHRVSAHVAREVAVYERGLGGWKDTLMSLAAELEAACRDLVAEAITSFVGRPTR